MDTTPRYLVKAYVHGTYDCLAEWESDIRHGAAALQREAAEHGLTGLVTLRVRNAWNRFDRPTVHHVEA